MSVEIVAADWPANGVIAGTTTRVGGVSEGSYASLNLAEHVGDAATAVAENRRRLASALQLPKAPMWLNQVHGTQVFIAHDELPASPPPTADAIVSPRGGDVLTIMTADCLPILLCSSARDELAAMHCGWRGLAGGIVVETVSAMESAPPELMAWLGPGISQAAFEVGDDVREIFLAGVDDAVKCFEPNQNGRWQADLAGLARRYLGVAGIERVYECKLCTHADSGRFFSHRRDGQCGRMASFAFRL